MTSESTRCGFVTFLGATNAGKSTLLNHMVGSKVSIVTHKVQTTRALIRGIGMHNETQIIYVDTPGIFDPRRRLDRAMIKTAWSGTQDADVVCLLIDAKRGFNEAIGEILERLKSVRQPKLLVLNKIDLVPRAELLALTDKANEICKFDETFMVSALNGDGVPDLMENLCGRMPKGPWHYPEDQASDLPMRQLAAEITREKLFLRLHEELPYASTVETEAWKTLKDGSARVEQTIFVQRDSQKKIVIGKGGQTIRGISSDARHEMAEIYGQKIHLFLFVKVRENWIDDPERYREMGIDFTK
ncbi:MAG: GTPase Era [Hyphomicrobiales bacterium]